MERIDFDIVNLEAEKPEEVIHAYVALHENCIEYNVQYYATQNDDVRGWQQGVWHDYNEIIPKECIGQIYCSYKDHANQWRVNVSSSAGDDFYVIFSDEQKAKALFNKIKAWKFNL